MNSVNSFQLTRFTDILQESEGFKISDSWLDFPKSCREEGLRVYKIVEGARKIKASIKKRQGRTRALLEYCEKENIKPKTLYRWIRTADKALETSITDNIGAQINALSPKYGKTRNRFRSWHAKNDEYPALVFAISIFLSQHCPNLTDVYKITVKEASINNWPIGSYRTLLNAITRINKATVALARQGKRKFEAARIKKILRNYEEIPPNFMWCGDHHIFDVFVKVPDSKGGWTVLRPWVTAWLDVRSRSLMGWVISFNPNSQAIAMALAYAISDKKDLNFPQHGLPDSIYVDNGKDYRSKLLNGEVIDIGNIDYPDIIEKYAALGIDPFYIDLKYDPEDGIWKKKHGNKEIVVKGVRVGGVYAALGIGHRYATVYSPWAKLIERFFRNVVQSF